MSHIRTFRACHGIYDPLNYVPHVYTSNNGRASIYDVQCTFPTNATACSTCLPLRVTLSLRFLPSIPFLVLPVRRSLARRRPTKSPWPRLSKWRRATELKKNRGRMRERETRRRSLLTGSHAFNRLPRRPPFRVYRDRKPSPTPLHAVRAQLQPSRRRALPSDSLSIIHRCRS